MQVQELRTTNFPEGTKAEQAMSFIMENFEQVIDCFDCHEKTRRKYKSDVKSFISFVSSEGLHVNTFRDYKKHLAALTTISTKTKAVKLTAAKRLLQELKDRYQILKVDLTSGTKNFQISAEHVRDGLSKSEVEKVKAEIMKERDSFKRSRLLAMFTLLAFQGLRQFEVTSLQVEDLRLEDGTAYVKGKGRDDQEMIDLHPQTVNALREYIQLAGKKSGFLFSSISRAAKDTNKPLTERGIRKIFSGIFSVSGIQNRTVHGFRHSFVTTFLEITSGDLLTVQKFSRHKSLQAIKFYDDRKRKRELLPMYYQAFA